MASHIPHIPVGKSCWLYHPSKNIQNPITSHHLYQIHSFSPKLSQCQGLVSKHSQNNPWKIYVRLCPTSLKSSNGFSTPIPHSASSMPDTLGPQGLPSVCHNLPLYITYTLLTFFKSLLTGHLLNEGFTKPLCKSAIHLNTSFIFIPSSVSLHNI